MFMKNNYLDARTQAERKEDSEIKSITTTSDGGFSKLKGEIDYIVLNAKELFNILINDRYFICFGDDDDEALIWDNLKKTDKHIPKWVKEIIKKLK